MSLPRSPQEGEREIGGGEGDWRGRGSSLKPRVTIKDAVHGHNLSLHMCAVVITRYVAYNFNGTVYIRDYDTLMLYFR